MKRVVVVTAVAVLAVLAGALTGCEFPEPATPQEQVQGFLTEASAVPQEPEAMKAYFDPETAQYVNMQLPAYWESTYFNDLQGPYVILDPIDGLEDPDFPGSVTVTGNVTNIGDPDAGYPAVFVLTTDPDTFFPDPLIRRITVTVTDPPEVIEKVIP